MFWRIILVLCILTGQNFYFSANALAVIETSPSTMTPDFDRKFFKQTKYWTSFVFQSEKNYLFCIQSTSVSIKDAVMATLILNTEGYDSGYINIHIEMFLHGIPYIENKENKIGRIIIDDEESIIRYSSELNEKSQSGFMSFYISDANALIRRMKKGNSLTLILPSLELSSTFSLHGFTSALSRLEGMCQTIR